MSICEGQENNTKTAPPSPRLVGQTPFDQSCTGTNIQLQCPSHRRIVWRVWPAFDWLCECEWSGPWEKPHVEKSGSIWNHGGCPGREGTSEQWPINRAKGERYRRTNSCRQLLSCYSLYSHLLIQFAAASLAAVLDGARSALTLLLLYLSQDSQRRATAGRVLRAYVLLMCSWW